MEVTPINSDAVAATVEIGLVSGSRDQAYLNRSGDRVRIDWGYFHLAVPDSANPTTEMSTDAMAQFQENGSLSDSDDLSMPRPANSTAGSGAHLAVRIPFGQVGNVAIKQH